MIGRCHECGATVWEGDEFTRSSLGPLCGSCSEALAQPEVVPVLTIRRYQDLRDVEQGRLSAYQRGQSTSPDLKSLAPISDPAERLGQEDEARRAVRPLCSGVHVMPIRGRAVVAADPVTSKR